MLAINIALKREDGKVECDTLYGEKMLTLEQLAEIGDKYKCDVIVSLIGELTVYDEEKIKENTLVFTRLKEEKKENVKRRKKRNSAVL